MEVFVELFMELFGGIGRGIVRGIVRWNCSCLEKTNVLWRCVLALPAEVLLTICLALSFKLSCHDCAFDRASDASRLAALSSSLLAIVTKKQMREIHSYRYIYKKKVQKTKILFF